MLFNGKADLWFETVWGSFCDKEGDGQNYLKAGKGSAKTFPLWVLTLLRNDTGNLPLKMFEKLDTRDIEATQRERLCA